MFKYIFNMEYRALITSEENKTFTNSIEKKDISDLPENDTLIKVKYSSLNYKDALSASGNKGVTRNYPHTPGAIDQRADSLRPTKDYPRHA